MTDVGGFLPRIRVLAVSVFQKRARVLENVFLDEGILRHPTVAHRAHHVDYQINVEDYVQNCKYH